jgi:hypothetical protein
MDLGKTRAFKLVPKVMPMADLSIYDFFTELFIIKDVTALIFNRFHNLTTTPLPTVEDTWNQIR